HFVAANIDDGDNDVVANHDAFVTVSRQNQHRWLLPHDRQDARCARRVGCSRGGGGNRGRALALRLWAATYYVFRPFAEKTSSGNGQPAAPEPGTQAL